MSRRKIIKIMEIVHKRLVTNTGALFAELEKLGYKEVARKGRGLDETITFQKGNKFVDTSHNQIMLYVKDKKGVPQASHVGLTVHDEMLQFFTQRTPTIPDKPW